MHNASTAGVAQQYYIQYKLKKKKKPADKLQHCVIRKYDTVC